MITNIAVNRITVKGVICKSLSSITGSFIPKKIERKNEQIKKTIADNEENNKDLKKKCPYPNCNGKGNSDKCSKDKIHYVLKDCPNYRELNELLEVASNEKIGNLIDLTNETANINSKKLHKDLKEENLSVIFYEQSNVERFQKVNENSDYSSRNLIEPSRYYPNEQTRIYLTTLPKDLKEENLSVITEDQSKIRRFQKMNENLIYSSSDLNEPLRYYPNEQTRIYSTTLPKDLKEENLSVIFYEQSNVERFQKVNENSDYSSRNLIEPSRYYPNEQTRIYLTTLPKDLKEENHSIVIDEQSNVARFRLDNRTLYNQVSDLRQQLFNEQNQNFFKLIRILNDFTSNYFFY